MRLLSCQPVADDYVEYLQQDLNDAVLCRFVVAYVSSPGLAAMDRSALAQVMRNSQSFGVASLTCSCGYRPLLDLHDSIGDVDVTRLKYFVDPCTDLRAPDGISLLHTKLVYLVLKGMERAVVYIGSHNWTGRALGSGGPRNAEASVRIEAGFLPEQLEGKGSGIFSDVNRHLLECWNMPPCFPATQEYESMFAEWEANACRKERDVPLDPITVVLAVTRGVTANDHTRWPGLAGKSLYLQAFDEQDGGMIPGIGTRMLVLCWASDDDLLNSAPPTILVCRVSTGNAGRESSIRGTNEADNPISGFECVVWDDAQLTAAKTKAGQAQRRAAVELHNGLHVETFDMEFPPPVHDSSELDAGTRPRYQYNLEIDHVVLPETADHFDLTEYLWNPARFGVSKRKSVSRVRTPGYNVGTKAPGEIEAYLQSEFCVEKSAMRLSPYSGIASGDIGLRVSEHPLHASYCGCFENGETFAVKRRNCKSGWLVPGWSGADAKYPEASTVNRVLKVYAIPLDQLLDSWRRT